MFFCLVSVNEAMEALLYCLATNRSRIENRFLARLKLASFAIMNTSRLFIMSLGLNWRWVHNDTEIPFGLASRAVTSDWLYILYGCQWRVIVVAARPHLLSHRVIIYFPLPVPYLCTRPMSRVGARRDGAVMAAINDWHVVIPLDRWSLINMPRRVTVASEWSFSISPMLACLFIALLYYQWPLF